MLKCSVTNMSTKLLAVAACAYRAVREDELSVPEGEEVEVLEGAFDGRVLVRRKGDMGRVPGYFLAIKEPHMDDLQGRVRYRRRWFSVVDGCGEVESSESSQELQTSAPASHPDTLPNLTDGRPLFSLPLRDMCVREGDSVSLHCAVLSPSPFAVTWRGPAVQTADCEAHCTGSSLRLHIASVSALHSGPYSLVAENEIGVSSECCMLSVVSRPLPPGGVVFSRTGPAAIRLTWNGNASEYKYCVEYTRQDLCCWRSARSGLSVCRVTLRHFRPTVYRIRVIAYNAHFRSAASDEVVVDFEKGKSILTDLPAFSPHYTFGRVVTECSRGVICEAHREDSTDGEGALAKIFSRSLSPGSIERECAILSSLNHPHLTRSEGVFTSPRGIVAVLSRAGGVDVTRYVAGLGFVSERILQLITQQVLSALEYLHNMQIVHLNIKPSSVLVGERVVVCGVSCARRLDSLECGWPAREGAFLPPEITREARPTETADVWSLGALLSVLCWGGVPSGRGGALPIHTLRPAHRIHAHSRTLVALIGHMILNEPGKRPTVADCLQHAWITQPASDEMWMTEHVEKWLREAELENTQDD